MDIRVLSVTDGSGNSYQFQRSNSGDNVMLKIGDPNRTITGVHEYVITYTAGGALTYFQDHDELYWNVTGNEWTVDIAKASASVSFPDRLTDNQVKVACYSGPKGSTEQSCSSQFGGNTAEFRTQSSLPVQSGLTVAVSFPKGLTAVLEPTLVVSFFDTIIGKIVIFGMILIMLFWYLIYPVKIIVAWFTHGRDPKGTVGVTRAWFDPPKLPGGRSLTPAEVGTLGDETADMKDISATIVDLARRGYMRIEERKKSDFYFVKTAQNKSTDSLLPFEKNLLDGIFGNSNSIRLKDEELYDTVNGVKNDLYTQVVSDKLFPKNPQSIRIFYSVIAILALVTGNLFLAAVAFLFGRNMPRKTMDGVNAFNTAKSLKNFLSSQERQLTFQADKQMMFEKLLPYAIAFGVEKIWAKRFSSINLQEPDWYKGYGYSTFNSVVFANSMNSSLSSFRSSSSPPRSSSGFSSGFSGGGFSGGGGGGGGGGSW